MADDKNSRRTRKPARPRRGNPAVSSGEERAPTPYRPRHLLKKPRRKKKKTRLGIVGSVKALVQRRMTPRQMVGFFLRFAVTFILIMLIGVLYVAKDLPDLSKLNVIDKKPSITVKTEDGTVLGAYGDVYGDYLKYEDFPKHLIDAVVATEDRNFFHHFGVDPLGIARAMFANIRAGHIVQGGSTITQQVAKNIFLTPDRTIKRKLQEMLLSFWLEYKYTKEEILALYLNRVYLGAGNYGVDAASRRYFQIPAQKMDLSESALMVGLLKAPSRYAPTSNPDLAKKRAEQVLLNMEDAGFIDHKTQQAAVKQFPDKFSYRDGSVSGSLYFTDWVVDQIPDILENVQEDITVTTTLNPKYQAFAEESVEKILAEKGTELNVSQASLVAMEPSGAIRAMVGGKNYQHSQFNRATQAQRQPGSSFKLFVYLAALEAGYNPDDVMEDKPISIGKWHPKNYSGDYKGAMSLKDAFAESVNTIAVQLSENVGPNRVVYMANRLGIDNVSPDASIALGTNEVNLLKLTGAFAHLAAEGNAVHPFAIKQILDSEGNVLFEHTDQFAGRVLAPSIVAKMNTLLSGVVNYGTGRGAAIGRPIAGKTGTSQDFKDAWFVGFTPQLATGVWVGNDDNTPMKKVTGGSVPASIWAGFMRQAMEGDAVMDIPTGYADDGNSLPWLNQNPAAQNAPEQPTTSKKDPDVKLGTSFWDKLFGDDVEHDYPSDRKP